VLGSSETGDLDHLIRVMPERGEYASVSRRVAMFRQLGVVISVGLADSLNPSTVGPALFLAAGRDRVRRVAEFTLGVWVVNLAGGLLLMIGPGRLLLDLVPHPRGTVRHIIELVAGVILVALALTTWAARRKLARRPLPGAKGGGGSSFVTGASLAAVELPTAAPYLAVIAGLVASTVTIPEEILLLLLYNLAFIAPMLVILGVLVVAGDRADPWLRRVGDWIQRRWPVVLAGLLMFVGGGLAILGGLGLLGGP
jgi:cytochrome c biogenesis protein CcdA